VEELVTIRTFSFPHDAELARMQLDGCGLEAHLADELTVSALSVIGPALGGVRLQVRASDVAHAIAILDGETEPGGPPSGPYRRAPEDIDDDPPEADDSWDDDALSPLDPEMLQQLERASDRGVMLGRRGSRPGAGQAAANDESELELALASPDSLVVPPGDRLAQRAYNASLLGILLLPPLLQLYSAWLLTELSASKLLMTERGRKQQRVARLLNAVIFVLTALACAKLLL
jgi:hypothetical protein